MKEKEIPDYIINAIISCCENDLSKEQAEGLLAWINEDEENLTLFKETVRLWHVSGLLCNKDFDSNEAWKTLVDKVNENASRPFRRKVVELKLSWLLTAAAVLLIITATGILMLILKDKIQTGQGMYEAVAPKGSRSVLNMSDGSIIWLNSASTIKYDAGYGRRNRHLTLEGEAYFVVSGNNKLPFVVNTSDIKVTATGTAFNIKAYKEEKYIETTLEAGEVRIDYKVSKGKKAEKSSVILKPNQKAIYFKADNTLSFADKKSLTNKEAEQVQTKVSPEIPIKVDTLVDTKLSTSWKDSKWIFKSEKLCNLAPIIERRYNVTINFGDTALYHYRFTGTIREESLEQVLRAISLAAPIKYVITHNEVYLYEDLTARYKYLKEP